MKKIILTTLVLIIIGGPLIVAGSSFVASLIAGKTPEEAVSILGYQLDSVLGSVQEVEQQQAIIESAQADANASSSALQQQISELSERLEKTQSAYQQSQSELSQLQEEQQEIVSNIADVQEYQENQSMAIQSITSTLPPPPPPEVRSLEVISTNSGAYPESRILKAYNWTQPVRSKIFGVNFKAGGNAEVHISSLKLKILGTVFPSLLKDVKVNGGGKMSNEVNPDSEGILWIPTAITIPANGSSGAEVLIDLNVDQLEVNSGKTISLSLEYVGTDAQVISSFPITGYDYVASSTRYK